MANFVIRLGQESDLSSVVAIDTEAFSPYGTTEEPRIIASRLSTFPDGFVVLETEGIIAGYGSSEKWASEREPVMNEDASTSHDPAGRIFCITAMAVKSDQQNKGIGSAILERLLLIAHQQDCTRVVLETTHAKDFYLHRGFHVAGTREQMNTTLFVMAKEL
ncbi:MAG: GNAT family N-acetyltransferase [Anaerolineae bacterium]|nr:GNAT family N-acetyltransferase [Anaerolineae bacterium]